MNQDIRMAGGKLPAGIPPDYGVQLLHLRRRMKPLLYPAIFRDGDGLAIELPPGYEQKTEIDGGGTGSPVICGILIPGAGIRAKRYTLERNGTKVEVLNVVNSDKKEGAFLNLRESTLKSVKKVWAFDVAGGPKEVALKRGAALRIPVPVALASTLVLVERCEPVLTIEAPSYGAWGEKIPVKVKVLNLNDRDLAGRLQIGKREGFISSEVKYGPIAPGEEKVYDVELTSKKGAPAGRHDLEVIAEGDGLKASRLFWVYLGNPLRLAIYPAAERLGVNVHLENFSAAPIEGTCTLVKDEVFKTPEPSYAFKVPPGEKTRVMMPLDLNAPLDMIRAARVEVKYGPCTVPLVKSVVPPVPNPGFEIDLAGDGHPDYWMGRCQPGDPVIGYSQWGLDRQDKHSGNASVWLNPPGPTQTSTALASPGGMLHFGKKYRVKVAIKREKASDKVYALFGCGGGSVTLGQKGNAGTWEEFEGTLSTSKQSADPFQGGDIDGFWTRLENGSTGKVWFDSIRVEEIP